MLQFRSYSFSKNGNRRDLQRCLPICAHFACKRIVITCHACKYGMQLNVKKEVGKAGLAEKIKVESPRLVRDQCSRKFSLQASGRELYIQDQSSHGTFVNQTRIESQKKVQLYTGDQIDFVNLGAWSPLLREQRIEGSASFLSAIDSSSRHKRPIAAGSLSLKKTSMGLPRSAHWSRRKKAVKKWPFSHIPECEYLVGFK